jgi:hypothetical protein
MDYLKKLGDSDLDYLNRFMAEYVSGAFKKTEDGEYSSENLHQTQEERRECYNRNNTRNRCGLTISNATGQTFRANNINDFMDSLTDATELEDYVNKFSDTVIDEYGGDYDSVEENLLCQMIEDYNKCISPKTESDKKLAESNYGKMLISKFKNS